MRSTLIFAKKKIIRESSWSSLNFVAHPGLAGNPVLAGLAANTLTS